MKAWHFCCVLLIAFLAWTVYHNYSKHPGNSLI
jgi:hypothetical protein